MAQTKLSDRQKTDSIDLTAEVTNTLPVANGGTGANTFTAGLVKASGTSAFTTVATVAVTDGGTGASTAATARTNLSAARAFHHNVKDYAAAGDGSTDDTTAIANALTAAAGSGGLGVVYFPPGIYITSPIAVPPGVVLQGANAQNYYNATTTIPNSNAVSTLKLKSGSTGALLSPYDGGTNISCSVDISDLALNCNGINQPAINMPDQGSSISRFWSIERCYVYNVNSANTASGYAVYIGNQNTAVVMRDCSIFNGTSGSAAGYNGIGWYGSDGYMDNCWVGWFVNNGLTVLGGSSDISFVMNGGGVFGCTTGVVVGGAGSVFQQASFDHNFNDGVYVGYSTVLTNCTFHTNSRTTNNVWSNINANGTGITVAVIGCRAAPLDSGYGTNNPAYMVNNTGSGNTIWLFGNYNEGATFGTGWTNYSGANAPILKGTSDGISQGQFLGALGTGLVKNTTTTGVLSIGAAGTDYVAPGGALGTPSSGTLTNCTFPTLNQNTTGSAATLTTARNINGVSFNGSANITIIPRINTTASSATPAINVDTTDQFNITALAAAITSMTSGLSGTPVDGQKLMIRIKDNGTARAITWGTSFVSSGVATLLATTVASKTHRVGLIYDSAMAKWTCVAVDAAGA